MDENVLSRTLAPFTAQIKVTRIKRAMRRCTSLFGFAAVLSTSFLYLPAMAGSEPPADTLQRVQQLIQQGDLVGARSQLTQSLKDFPREVGFYNLLGVVEAQ